MRPFRDRSPLVLGVIGLVVIAAVVLSLVQLRRARDVPYSAAFREAAGLEPGAAVRVAGVRVGRVTGLDLEDGHVRVDLAIGAAVALGSGTRATIGVESVAGTKFLALDPDGPGRLAAAAEIPLGRTASPYDLVDAVSGLSRTVGQIDTAQLGAAFDALSAAFADTPESVRGSLRGLSKLSATIAARDSQLTELLARGRTVTRVLAERDTEFRKLLADGALLLRAVTARRDAIGALLTNTTELARQLTALIAENRATLKPALAGLRTVAGLLQRNQSKLEESLALLGPYVQTFANALGTGPWLDVYLHNLDPR